MANLGSESVVVCYLNQPPQGPHAIAIIMTDPEYRLLTGDDITEDIVESCAILSSTNYGIWGDIALSCTPYTKPGMCRSVPLTYPLTLPNKPTRQVFWEEVARGMHR